MDPDKNKIKEKEEEEEEEEEDSPSPYDPVEVAKNQGKLYAAGLSGHYRKNLFTRVGFLIFALVVLVLGVAQNVVIFTTTGGDFLAEYFCLVSGLVAIYIGVRIFIKVFSKSK